MSELDDLEAVASGAPSPSPQEPKPAPTLDGILSQAEAAGHPKSALEALRSHADLIRRISGIAKIDLDAEIQAVWDHLPNFRRSRAEREREAASQSASPAEREARLRHAKQLVTQAQNLASPTAEDRFRARALVTELSIRLAARLRGIEVSLPNVEPSSLRTFEKTFQDHTRGVEASGMSRQDAQHAARLAFLQALVEADATPDDPAGLRAAIVRYRKNTTRDYGVEPGHLHDQPLSETPQAIEVPAQVESEALDTDRAIAVSRLSRSLSLAAAAELNPRHYAIYRVLSENTHLFDWRLGPDGKLVFVKRDGAGRGENIAVQVMQEVGGYAGRGAAYRAVHDTLDRLGEALHKYGRDVTTEDIPVEKRTRATDRLTASRKQVMEAARTPRTPAEAVPVSRKQEAAEIE